ncbi:hypothetical protein MCHI_000912 [Candidatus Magnetoovum chiemensis]|nr:hypothetical protein MCHI_000912 [Candidatus Magnetoovum chiemensis]
MLLPAFKSSECVSASVTLLSESITFLSSAVLLSALFSVSAFFFLFFSDGSSFSFSNFFKYSSTAFSSNSSASLSIIFKAS